MTPVRLALVGFGKWGRNYIRAARDSGEAEVSQVVLRPGSAHRAEAEAAGLAVVHDVDALDVDAAVISIHPRAAPFVARVMLEICALPVMVEKPAALSVADALTLLSGEEVSKKVVLIAHQHLFAERFELLMRVPGQGDLTVDTIFDGPVVRDYPSLWDYGSHAAACALALVGPPERDVEAIPTRPLPDLLRDASFFRWKGPRGYAHCHVRFAGERKAWARSNGFEYDGYAPAEPALTRAVRAFARAVRAGGTDDPRFGARWAVDVARVLEGAGQFLDGRDRRL